MPDPNVMREMAARLSEFADREERGEIKVAVIMGFALISADALAEGLSANFDDDEWVIRLEDKVEAGGGVYSDGPERLRDIASLAFIEFAGEEEEDG